MTFFFNPKKLRYQAAASWRPLPEFPCHVIQGQRLNFFLPCFLYRQILLSWLSNGPSKLFSLHISISIIYICTYQLTVVNKSVLNMDHDLLCQVYEWQPTFCKFLKTTLGEDKKDSDRILLEMIHTWIHYLPILKDCQRQSMIFIRAKTLPGANL